MYFICRSRRRKVLLPKPKSIFPSMTTASHPLTPSQSSLITTSTTTTSTQITSTPTVPPSPYVITQNTGAPQFTSSAQFPVPPVPVQNTVIVQQGSQSVYVQQQVRGLLLYLHVTKPDTSLAKRVLVKCQIITNEVFYP